jgi:hypothetical protein
LSGSLALPPPPRKTLKLGSRVPIRTGVGATQYDYITHGIQILMERYVGMYEYEIQFLWRLISILTKLFWFEQKGIPWVT